MPPINLCCSSIDAVKYIPLQHLQSCLHSDPETGEIYWKKCDGDYFAESTSRPGHKAKFVGELAGYRLDTGYWQVDVNYNGTCHRVLGHYLIWVMSGKPIIDGYVIDHINQDKTDNRLCNLRYGPIQHNAWNTTRKGKKDTSLPTGVFKKRKRWSARIKNMDQLITLGIYDTVEEAATARQDFVNKYYAMYVDGVYRPELFGQLPITFSSLSPSEERWVNSIGSL